MKQIKVWLEAEEYDTETDKHRNLCQSGEVEPVPVGVFDSLEKAAEWMKDKDMWRTL